VLAECSPCSTCLSIAATARWLRRAQRRRPGEKNKHRIFATGRYLNQRLVDEGVAKGL